MSARVKRVEPVRERPWDWATKNEYEEVTVRIQPYLHGHYRHKYRKTEYDIYDPRYTRLRSSNWDAFRDPKRFWYYPYTLNRKRMADDVESLFDRALKLGLQDHVADSWRRFSEEFYIPLRHYEYAGAVQLQHVVRYAMGGPIEQVATYTAFDKQGRAQWLSSWGLDFPGGGGSAALEHGKELWLDDPAFQGLREYMEQVLTTEDWGEVLTALHLAVEPLVDGILYDGLNAVALAHGDVVLPELSLICQEQIKWQEQWSQAFFTWITEDPASSRWEYLKALGYENWPGDYRWGKTLSDPRETPEEELTNREVVAEWLSLWLPRALEAVRGLQPVFDRHGIPFSVASSVERTVDQAIRPLVRAMGIESLPTLGGEQHVE
ncbi:toluene hydroxylase [Kyrpidia spormannii]|uniref:propane 2-monooxygenase n=1 Tax=Kyrpidia spormannii TaxID=2055160 RepID=A0A2K8NB49_9BACL|nr:toluene hydroxylase [Kyrpidia spormannii]ATY86554.1 toluene hydroxylase [Kyrpidia spormannii]